MNYLGIDPGVGGGLALIDREGNPVLVTKMPATEREIWNWVHDSLDDAHPGNQHIFACIEQLGGMPRADTTAKCKRCGQICKVTKPMQSPTTMLKMGTNYGLLRMALTGSGVRYEEVLPKIWQSLFGLVFSSKQNLTSTQKKNRHKQKAEQLFPNVKITHAVADALLIAEFARRTHRAARYCQPRESVA
jgi:hypothetical protein